MASIPTAAPGDALDRHIARLLQVGTYASVVLIAIGVATMVATGRSPLDASLPLTLDRLVSDVGALRPEGFLWLGLLAVIATPTGRVVASLVGYLRGAERTMAIVSVAILVVVAISIAVGIALRTAV